MIKNITSGAIFIALLTALVYLGCKKTESSITKEVALDSKTASILKAWVTD